MFQLSKRMNDVENETFILQLSVSSSITAEF